MNPLTTAIPLLYICAFRVGCSLLRVWNISASAATTEKKERVGAYVLSGACSLFK
jgi:hypothetical protein